VSNKNESISIDNLPSLLYFKARKKLTLSHGMFPKKLVSLLIAIFIIATSKAVSQETKLSSKQTKDPYVIQRLNCPITLDGLSIEEAWQDIRPLPMVTMFPSYGNPPSEKTEILVAFDDNFLYVAGRLYDKEPSKIQSPSKKRDYFESNTDWLGVIIDTFNDKENALGFFTNPSGLRSDTTVFDDAVPRTPTSSPLNTSWNTFWDVKTVWNSEGWFAEMRIPFSSLRFQDKEGRVIMGLKVIRWIPHKNELSSFPAVYPKWGTWSVWKPSQTQEVLLEGVHSRLPLYLTPYALTGYGQNYELNEEETAYNRTNKPTSEAGLDLKYGLTSNLTLDLTLNTDFAQVEADDYQINLTRFDLFFPEKRLFFQERGSIFDFSFGEYNQLFYSRRIGIYEEEAVRIYGGTRLVGRVGSWDLGFLDMQAAPVKDEDLPSENFGVLRARRRVFNSYSYVGAMVTSRIGTDGSYNAAYGLDGIFRVSGDDYFLFNWAQTFENGYKNYLVSFDPARLRIAWERRTEKGLGMNLSYSRAGNDYNPGMGFEMRENFSRFGNRILYGWLMGEKSFLQSHSIFLDGFLFLRNSDNSIESAEIGPGWKFLTKSGYYGEFAFKIYREGVQESFSLSDEADVPPGEYTFYGLTGYLQTSMGSLFSTLVTVDAGSFYDGWRASISLTPVWGISSNLTLSGLCEFDRVEFPDRKQKFTGQIAQLRVLATLSLKFSASAFIQYNSADHAMLANVRLRFNPREGNDLYLVFNEDFNTHRHREIPHLPYYNNRAIMVKYSYTFSF
jgi:hypothetical protein